MRPRVVVYRVFFWHFPPYQACWAQFTTRNKDEAERVFAEHADYRPVLKRKFMPRCRAAMWVREGWRNGDESVRARGWY
jgi:hypothetical protein